jgi:hypothetical protein
MVKIRLKNIVVIDGEYLMIKLLDRFAMGGD